MCFVEDLLSEHKNLKSFYFDEFKIIDYFSIYANKRDSYYFDTISK